MRCRKAHWFLSAQCDDTLSERQRRDLAAHLEECPSCRREAFYFSEIRGQTGNLARVRTRADFNLRLRARINAWETEAEGVRSKRPSLWWVFGEYPRWLRDLISDAGDILLGQRRLALVGVFSLVLVVAVWTGYRANQNQLDNLSYVPQLAVGQEETELSREPAGIDDYYFVGLTEGGEEDWNYVVSAVSLADDISPRTQPNYIMPTVPAEEIRARAIF